MLWLAGMASGAMSALAGLAGPALAAFALLTRWPQERFVATVQPYFIIVGAGTVLVTLLADTESWPTMARPVWLALGAAVLVVSMAGGVMTMADGLFSGGA